MEIRSKYRPWLLAVTATVFLVFQIFSTLHAATYGDQHHEHNGDACAIQIVGKAGKDITPPAPMGITRPDFCPSPVDHDDPNTVRVSRPYPHFYGRAPPASFS